jgi:hypothetical protein
MNKKQAHIGNVYEVTDRDAFEQATQMEGHLLRFRVLGLTSFGDQVEVQLIFKYGSRKAVFSGEFVDGLYKDRIVDRWD